MSIASAIAIAVTFTALGAVAADAAAGLRHRLRGPRRGSLLGLDESPATTRVFS